MSFFYDNNDDEDILLGWEFDTSEGCYVRTGRFCVPFPRPSRSRFQQDNVRPLYVRNLPGNVDGYGLGNMFSPFGTVTRTKVVQDRYENSKEFGFVWFSNDEEAGEALYWMNGRWVDDCELYVAPAEYREDREARLETELEQDDDEDGEEGDDDDDDDILYGWIYDVHEKQYVCTFSPRDCAPFPEPFSPAGPAQRNVRPLYVGNLYWEIDDDDLYNLFSPFGRVTRAEVITDWYGDSRRFGYVTFSTDEETNYAMYWMDGRCVQDYCLDVELANNWDEQDNDYRNNILYGWEYDVYEKAYVRTLPDCVPFPEPLQPAGPLQRKVQPLFVGNLTSRISNIDLQIMFSVFGSVTRTELALDRRGESKGFGYVWMTSSEEIDHAISWMDGRYVDGMELSVELANSDGPPRETRQTVCIPSVFDWWPTGSSGSSNVQPQTRAQTAAQKLELAKPGSAAA